MIQQMRDDEGATGGLDHIIIVENWFEELNRLVPIEVNSRN